MIKMILKAIKATDGGISSRRLGGFKALYVILILSLGGGITFLVKDQADNFCELDLGFIGFMRWPFGIDNI